MFLVNQNQPKYSIKNIKVNDRIKSNQIAKISSKI